MKELPQWVKGRVYAEVRQFVSGDAVGSTQADLVVDGVMRDLGMMPGEITPAVITQLVRRHLQASQEWAGTARKTQRRLDAMDETEAQED